MKLPLALVERDGHIWIKCTHLACMTQRQDRGYLHRLDAGQHASNGEKLHEALHHAMREHGAGTGELWLWTLSRL